MFYYNILISAPNKKYNGAEPQTKSKPKKHKGNIKKKLTSGLIYFFVM